MDYDYVDARDRIAELDKKLCLYIDIPVPEGTFDDVQRTFTGVLYDTARYYRAHVDEVQRVSGVGSASAIENRVLFFRAHRRSGWYLGKDPNGRAGFWKLVFHDKPKQRGAGNSFEPTPIASGIVDNDDHIRWRRTTEDGDERYLHVRVMKCLGCAIGRRNPFSGLLVVEEHSPTLLEKLKRVAASIRSLRPEVTLEIRHGEELL